MDRVERWLELRNRARTDLFWLCRQILGYLDIEESPHRQITDFLHPKFAGCNETAEKGKLKSSEPKIPLWEQTGPRRQMLLYPRGHLKTTLNTIGKAIQWVINYPPIRILISTAVGDQTQKTLSELKSHFQFNDHFRFLFPELCPPAAKAADFGTQESFSVYARGQFKKEPTVSTCSVGKVIAGFHYDVIFNADLVDKENVKTANQVREVIEHFGYMDPLLERGPYPPWHGWVYVEGTRYDFCLVGETRILMADWTHKPICNIKEGDEVIGWEFKTVTGKPRRWLVRSKVLATGFHFNIPVIKYSFASGGSVTCTKEHKWWIGKSWNHGPDSNEYASLGKRRSQLRSLRKLLVPIDNLLCSGSCDSSGWKERYRFLNQIYPYRSAKISESLFGQMVTERDDLAEISSAGNRDVYWFQTQTGDYIAEGYCSKNSDLYGHILDAEEKTTAKQWSVLIGDAEVDADKKVSLWPTRYPWQELKRIERDIGPQLYSGQYRNRPVPTSGGLTTIDKIRWIPRKIIQEMYPMLRKHVTIDLHGMQQNERNDYTAITLAGFDRDGRCLLIDMVCAHPTPFQVIEIIFDWHKRYPSIIDWKIEKEAHSRVLLPFMQREMTKRGLFPVIVPIQRDNQTSKKQRIKGLQPWFITSILQFADDLPCKTEIINQITRFSDHSTYPDDILDTLADQMQNREGGVSYDVIPDPPRWQPTIPPRDKFMGFDPLTHEPSWIMDNLYLGK